MALVFLFFFTMIERVFFRGSHQAIRAGSVQVDERDFWSDSVSSIRLRPNFLRPNLPSAKISSAKFAFGQNFLRPNRPKLLESTKFQPKSCRIDIFLAQDPQSGTRSEEHCTKDSTGWATHPHHSTKWYIEQISSQPEPPHLGPGLPR